MKSWILLAMLGAAWLGAPAGAQQSQPSGQTAPATDPEEQKKLNEMKMEFLNAPGAIWVNRSVNDTVYWSGYSPNSVYFERDAARVEAEMQRLTGGMNKVSDLTVEPSTQTKSYQLNINGKVVPVQSQP